jgi:hypothetical protein
MNNNLFNKEIKFMQQCPVCQTSRRLIKANILEEDETKRLLYLTCPTCQSSVIMLISLGMFGLESNGLITDLIPVEVLKYRQEEVINTNDLLDLHQIMAEKKFSINL